MLQPTPTALTTWPIPGDVPDLTAIVRDQATTMAAQMALIDAYQGVLANVQTVPPAMGAGNSTGTTSLTVSGVTAGSVLLGSVVAGTGVPVGTKIVSQTSGTVGKDGVYITTVPTTLTSVALTFTPSGVPMTWPLPAIADAPTLTLVQQSQSAILKTQTALIQQYIDLLNVTDTPAPPVGP